VRGEGGEGSDGKGMGRWTFFNLYLFVFKGHEGVKDYYEKALQIRKTLFGEHHLDVATSLYNLAVVAWESNQYDPINSAQVVAQFKKVLDIQVSLLGKSHPQVCEDAWRGMYPG
jgi:hypothetical protein